MSRFICLLLAVCLSACTTTRSISAQRLKPDSFKPGQEVRIVFVSGDTRKTRLRRLQDGVLSTDAGDFEMVDIAKLQKRKVDGGRTVILSAFFIGLGYLMLRGFARAFGEGVRDSVSCEFDQGNENCPQNY